jgi:hypothetical protein
MYNNYNPYYFQQPIQRTQGIEQVPQQPTYIQPIAKPIGLLGKVVDNIEVVRATDIPLDGSTSYFPLSDGSSIITKQLKADGTSKIVVYKPVDEDNKQQPTYITIDEFNERFSEINIDAIEDLMEDFKDVKKDIKDLKTKLKGKGD